MINLDDEIPINGSKYKYLYPIAMKFFSYSNLNKKLKEEIIISFGLEIFGIIVYTMLICVFIKTSIITLIFIDLEL